MNQKQRDTLSASLQTGIKWDVPMGAYSTLRAGGKADALVEVQELNELQQLVKQLDNLAIPSLVIGRGSNILISEQGFSGVIIQLRGTMNVISTPDEKNISENMLLTVGAGCSMAKLVSWCTQHCQSGLEFMVGIPGSVGGAVKMNAGAWGHEIGELLSEVTIVATNGILHHIPAAELDISYRKFKLKDRELGNGIITSATLSMTSDREKRIRQRCSDYLERRNGKQPLGAASAGSFFKNPPNDSAGRLIEAAGLKGTSCGQALVSPVHANFIVNTGQASAADIVDLMKKIQKKVFKQFGIMLEPEVQII